MLYFSAELPGFEPRTTGPESVVLPLHHNSIILAGWLRFEHRPLVLETNMLPLTPSTQIFY